MPRVQRASCPLSQLVAALVGGAAGSDVSMYSVCEFSCSCCKSSTAAAADALCSFLLADSTALQEFQNKSDGFKALQVGLVSRNTAVVCACVRVAGAVLQSLITHHSWPVKTGMTCTSVTPQQDHTQPQLEHTAGFAGNSSDAGCQKPQLHQQPPLQPQQQQLQPHPQLEPQQQQPQQLLQPPPQLQQQQQLLPASEDWLNSDGNPWLHAAAFAGAGTGLEPFDQQQARALTGFTAAAAAGAADTADSINSSIGTDAVYIAASSAPSSQLPIPCCGSRQQAATVAARMLSALLGKAQAAAEQPAPDVQAAALLELQQVLLLLAETLSPACVMPTDSCCCCPSSSSGCHNASSGRQSSGQCQQCQGHSSTNTISNRPYSVTMSGLDVTTMGWLSEVMAASVAALRDDNLSLRRAASQALAAAVVLQDTLACSTLPSPALPQPRPPIHRMT